MPDFSQMDTHQVMHLINQTAPDELPELLSELARFEKYQKTSGALDDLSGKLARLGYNDDSDIPEALREMTEGILDDLKDSYRAGPQAMQDITERLGRVVRIERTLPPEPA